MSNLSHVIYQVILVRPQDLECDFRWNYLWSMVFVVLFNKVMWSASGDIIVNSKNQKLSPAHFFSPFLLEPYLRPRARSHLLKLVPHRPIRQRRTRGHGLQITSTAPPLHRSRTQPQRRHNVQIAVLRLPDTVESAPLQLFRRCLGRVAHLHVAHAGCFLGRGEFGERRAVVARVRRGGRGKVCW